MGIQNHIFKILRRDPVRKMVDIEGIVKYDGFIDRQIFADARVGIEIKLLQPGFCIAFVLPGGFPVDRLIALHDIDADRFHQF